MELKWTLKAYTTVSISNIKGKKNIYYTLHSWNMVSHFTSRLYFYESNSTLTRVISIISLFPYRCPRGIVTSLNASPSVMASKKLGGVDQATLRQSLSNHNSLATPSDYLADAELWVWSEQLDSMEALQLDIANSDLQVQYI